MAPRRRSSVPRRSHRSASSHNKNQRLPGRGRASSAVVHNKEALIVSNPPETILHERHMPQDYVHLHTPKKRTCNPENWKRHHRITQPKPYRPCQCAKNCGSKLSEADLDSNRDFFFGIHNYNEQQKFLASMVRTKPAPRSQLPNTLSFEYFVKTATGIDLKVRSICHYFVTILYSNKMFPKSHHFYKNSIF